MYRLLEVRLQLPDKESTKGATPLATEFQVSAHENPKNNLKETYEIVISKVFPQKTRQLGFVQGNTSNENYYRTKGKSGTVFPQRPGKKRR